MATEAGIWRVPGGLYRQTWLSGGHAQTAPQRVTVTTWFASAPAEPATRTYLVPRGGRWAMTLDDLVPMGWTGQVDATVVVRCEGTCWATVALWHAPIARGVVPTVVPIMMRCEG